MIKDLYRSRQQEATDSHIESLRVRAMRGMFSKLFEGLPSNVTPKFTPEQLRGDNRLAQALVGLMTIIYRGPPPRLRRGAG